MPTIFTEEPSWSRYLPDPHRKGNTSCGVVQSRFPISRLLDYKLLRFVKFIHRSDDFRDFFDDDYYITVLDRTRNLQWAKIAQKNREDKLKSSLELPNVIEEKTTKKRKENKVEPNKKETLSQKRKFII